ncbi:hypothetical protein M0R45_007098 [Rubus argutus]|uniref:Uncharacterized protein n=1 Tax=Rubus argutus TaxID=59490 RepID=A0AAW1YSE9_RUBAR
MVSATPAMEVEQGGTAKGQRAWATAQQLVSKDGGDGECAARRQRGSRQSWNSRWAGLGAEGVAEMVGLRARRNSAWAGQFEMAGLLRWSRVQMWAEQGSSLAGLLAATTWVWRRRRHVGRSAWTTRRRWCFGQ